MDRTYTFLLTDLFDMLRQTHLQITVAKYFREVNLGNTKISVEVQRFLFIWFFVNTRFREVIMHKLPAKISKKFTGLSGQI